MQFEFQIEELENKIAELEKFAKEKEVELLDEINKLTPFFKKYYIPYTIQDN